MIRSEGMIGCHLFEEMLLRIYFDALRAVFI